MAADAVVNDDALPAAHGKDASAGNAVHTSQDVTRSATGETSEAMPPSPPAPTRHAGCTAVISKLVAQRGPLRRRMAGDEAIALGDVAEVYDRFSYRSFAHFRSPDRSR